MISGLVDENIAVTALRLGANNYLTKPYSLDRLNQILQTAQEHSELVEQGHPEGLPSEETTSKQVNITDVAKDLLDQQIALFERLTSPRTPGDKV